MGAHVYAARVKLQAAKDAYFQGKGFSDDEQKAIADYGDLSVSDNYGWSKNELLYAVQDGIVNSQPGTIDIVTNPNVTGRNITLLAPNGGIATDGDIRLSAGKGISIADDTMIRGQNLILFSGTGDIGAGRQSINTLPTGATLPRKSLQSRSMQPVEQIRRLLLPLKKSVSSIPTS
jgi:hypothetical protein